MKNIDSTVLKIVQTNIERAKRSHPDVCLDMLSEALRNGMAVRVGIQLLTDEATKLDAFGSSDNVRSVYGARPLVASTYLYEALAALASWRARSLENEL